MITASGTGQLGELLRAVDQSQFGFGSRYAIDVARIGGAGAIDVTVKQPMLDIVRPEDVAYDIRGRFQQVVMPDLLGEFGLSDANLSFDLEPAGHDGHRQRRIRPCARHASNGANALRPKARAASS